MELSCCFVYCDHYVVVHLSVGFVSFFTFRYLYSFVPHELSIHSVCFLLLCHIYYICLFNSILLLSCANLYFSPLAKVLESYFLLLLLTSPKNFSYCEKVGNEYHHLNLVCYSKHAYSLTLYCLIRLSHSNAFFSLFSHFIQNFD